MMYMKVPGMYISDILDETGSDSNDHCDQANSQTLSVGLAKIKRAQRALHAKTETEAIERALDFAIAEHEKNRLVADT